MSDIQSFLLTQFGELKDQVSDVNKKIASLEAEHSHNRERDKKTDSSIEALGNAVSEVREMMSGMGGKVEAMSAQLSKAQVNVEVGDKVMNDNSNKQSTHIEAGGNVQGVGTQGAGGGGLGESPAIVFAKQNKWYIAGGIAAAYALNIGGLQTTINGLMRPAPAAQAQTSPDTNFGENLEYQIPETDEPDTESGLGE